jgi:hypothetical protein
MDHVTAGVRRLGNRRLHACCGDCQQEQQCHDSW